ncbi:extracellular solute-binding protein [Paenibacillus sp. DXFW5]|uniref:Extracellular solute-binding protein n=1 Tax=Paenibacillus rhizolycopersici TaxID=2780073 RepID=A0ABS2H1L3_9BACL|nr:MULTISPECIES: extracellular solute-binding protein [Paenibacillus]MBM6995272.1 extracellular solute-binding protein [Paenibacillus rhizolycopersici]MUG85397.1 extracellular solute-binding protein [Paenibacillus timonensis]GIP46869.1 ABC transporter substrate-binding protein [Paenibacillus sp. J53TS2]
MGMKSKSKKMMMLLMAAIMVLSLAACGGNGNASKESANNKPANTNSQESTEPAATPSADEPGWKSDTSPITFDWYLNFAWFPNKWGVDPTSQYVTKKTGVNINFIVPAGNENEKLNTLIASGKLPDFITLGWYEDGVKKMIEGGLVEPLNKLAEQYDPYFFKIADPDKLGWYTQPDGNVYGYPNSSSSPKDYEQYGDTYVSNQTFVVRKDIYEAIGSPDMRTPEGFVAALKAAQEKFPEINGQPLIPLGLHEFTAVGNDSLEQYLQNFLAIPRQKDGKLYNRETDPEYVTWLKTLRKANEDGLLAKDIFIDKRAQMEEKIAQGRYFAMLYQRTDFAAQLGTLYQQDPNKIYIAVDGPANSKLDPPTLNGPSISGWTVTLISKDVKDKARAIKFLSYLMSEEGQKDLYLGEKGVSYDTIDGKDQFKPEAFDLMNKDRAAFDKQYGSSFTFWMMQNTNITQQWQPESVEPYKQLEDWTRGKTVSVSEFDLIDPLANSDEGIILSKIKDLRSKTLPKLLMAPSDAEFDKIWSDYIKKQEDLGLAKVQAFQQTKYEENKKKLGME